MPASAGMTDRDLACSAVHSVSQKLSGYNIIRVLNIIKLKPYNIINCNIVLEFQDYNIYNIIIFKKVIAEKAQMVV
jgi:hypothetical protein